MLQGSMTAEQLRLMQMSRSPIARVAPVIVFLLIFGNTAYRMFSIQHGVEQRNPERTTVSSTADAIRQLDEQDKKVEKDPQNPWAHKQRGLNYFDAEMYEKAIPDLTYTLSKNVDDETLWCRARCYLLTRQFDKALPDYEQLEKIAKKPYSHYIAQRGIGICDYHLGKYQPAVEAFTKALAISSVSESDRKELFHDRCLSYYKLGKQELADADRNARGNDVSKYWLMDDGPKNR
jgi:tetratricopeptide (TPR) repeat protein